MPLTVRLSNGPMQLFCPFGPSQLLAATGPGAAAGKSFPVLFIYMAGLAQQASTCSFTCAASLFCIMEAGLTSVKDSLHFQSTSDLPNQQMQQCRSSKDHNSALIASMQVSSTCLCLLRGHAVKLAHPGHRWCLCVGRPCPKRSPKLRRVDT